jgi:DNA-binding NarL/FixJ family response regulator
MKLALRNIRPVAETIAPSPISAQSQEGGKLPIKVLLADDSDFVRRAIAQLLKTEPTIELVGEAENYAETIEMTAALRPDLLLMDLHMPGEQKHDAAALSSQLLHSTNRILAISVWNDDATKNLAASLGASALLDKCNLGVELIPAILASDNNTI